MGKKKIWEKPEGFNGFGQAYGNDLDVSEITDQQWARAIRTYKRTGDWDRMHHGEPPGKEGCLAPDHLQVAGDALINELCKEFAQKRKGDS